MNILNFFTITLACIRNSVNYKKSSNPPSQLRDNILFRQFRRRAPERRRPTLLHNDPSTKSAGALQRPRSQWVRARVLTTYRQRSAGSRVSTDCVRPCRTDRSPPTAVLFAGTWTRWSPTSLKKSVRSSRTRLTVLNRF